MTIQSPCIIYLFNTNDSLKGVFVDVLATYLEELFSYLNERFIFDSADDYISYYRNAQKEEDVSMVIGLLDLGGDIVEVVYLEYTYSQTKTSHNVSGDFQQIRKRFEALQNR